MSTKTELEEIFLRKKPVKLLLNLNNGIKYISVLTKETDCTYSHTVKLLEQFQIAGLVEFSKEGRVKFVKLTLLGKSIADNFEVVMRKFSSIKK
ncbi:MAG: hypothetical protein J4473_00190 [Candidatus Aenigmarchaeota archaeon]|nr:hypothetical protein [Candidatus Aenigmarchaeota archaeon]